MLLIDRVRQVDADDVGDEVRETDEGLGPRQDRRLTANDLGRGFDPPARECVRQRGRRTALEHESTLVHFRPDGIGNREGYVEATHGGQRLADAVAGVASLTVRTRHRGVRAGAQDAEVLRARVAVVTGLVDGALRWHLASPVRRVTDLTVRTRHRRKSADASPRCARIGRARVAVVAGFGRVATDAGRTDVVRAGVTVVTHHGGVHATGGRHARVGRAGAAVVARDRRVKADAPHVTHVGRAGVGVATIRVGLTLGCRDGGILDTALRRADLPRQAECVAALVGHAVAVVVRVVANFDRAGVDRRVALETVLRRLEAVAVQVSQVTRNRVRDTVPVTVLVAGVAREVEVLVGLRRVPDERTVVHAVEHVVAVVVGIARVAARHGVGGQVRIAVGVELVDVRHDRTVVRRVDDGIIVIVGVHAVRPGVTIRVDRVFVGRTRTVVVDAVARLELAHEDRGVERRAVGLVRVEVAVVVEVTRVAARHWVGRAEHVVLVGIGLVDVHDESTVVHRIEDTVTVFVVITHVAHAVTVGVELTHIDDEVADVGRVGNAVVVVIEITLVATVRHGVGVELILVGRERTVVRHIRLMIAVVVLIAGVADGVPVRVGLHLTSTVRHTGDTNGRRGVRRGVGGSGHRRHTVGQERHVGGVVAIGDDRATDYPTDLHGRRIGETGTVVPVVGVTVAVEIVRLRPEVPERLPPDATTRRTGHSENGNECREERGGSTCLHETPLTLVLVSCPTVGVTPSGDSTGRTLPRTAANAIK